jgi:condensin complex subunit 3
VRKEAITCCGLLCVVNGAKPSAECVKILRAALAKDAATVKCAAAKALGDLALIFGPATLDALNGGDGNGAAGAEDSSDFDGDDDDAAAPLERAFLSALDDADAAVDAAAVAAAEERYSSNPSLGDDDLGVDVSGGKIAAEAEAESCVGTAAAEALAKLCLRRGAAAFASAPAVVSKLLRTYFAVDARSRPRLAQCLAVFFPALASGPEDRRRLVSDAALPTLRAAAKQKGVAKVANYLVHLLTACAPVVEMAASIAATAAVSDDVTEDTTSTSASAKTAPGPAATARGEVLIASLLKEALAVTLRPTSLYATTAEKTLSKAYVGALAKVAAHGCVLDGRASSERTALAHASVAVKLCAARVAEKTAAKDLNVASTNVARAMKQLLFAADEETEDDATTTAEDAEEATTAAVMAECEALSRSRELGVADGVSGVALIPTTKAVKAADAKEKETTPPPEEIDATEEEEEEEPTAAKGKAGRAARGSRAALKENFAR